MSGFAVPRKKTDNETLFRVVRSWTHDNLEGRRAAEVTIRLRNGREVKLPVMYPEAAAAEAEQFVPTAFQNAILDALEGKALRSRALGTAVGDERRLFRHPGGIKELEDQGLVAKHQRLGYYRADAPPPELEGEEGVN